MTLFLNFHTHKTVIRNFTVFQYITCRVTGNKGKESGKGSHYLVGPLFCSFILANAYTDMVQVVRI